MNIVKNPIFFSCMLQFFGFKTLSSPLLSLGNLTLGKQHHRPEIGKVLPAGHIWPTTCFCKEFYWNTGIPIGCILSMADFILWQQSWVVVMDAIWSTKVECLLTSSF